MRSIFLTLFQRRRKEDDEANNKPVRILRASGFETVATKELLVGDIVLIKNDEEITADILPLSTSNPGGICSVETANLDGYAPTRYYYEI
jgi:P-type E1-E2 ATPase